VRSPARTTLVAAALTAGLIVAGCGAKKQDLAPAACLTTNEGYLRALERAPAPVRLPGSVPISSCLVPEQQPGQLADIGHALLIAATKLNVESRRDPGGPASVQLGYLLGAIAKGADPIHTDLVRRLNAAAQFTQGGSSLPASFQRVFGRGYQAGHTTG
jgi:hypothetical protein